jgi:hypothetical protein
MQTTITKSQVSNVLLLEYLNKKRYYGEQINALEKKYRLNFGEFEKAINEQEVEDEQKWDDYIDWKAYTEFLSTTLKTIDDIKYGNFKVV